MSRRPHWTDCACGHPEGWHAGKDCLAVRKCGCMVYRLGDVRCPQ